MPARNRRSRRRSRHEPPVPNGPAASRIPDRDSNLALSDTLAHVSNDPANGYGIVSRSKHIELRKYQCRMICESLFENTIVVLPPGAGKTVIAGEVIARIGVPALFFVPTVYLVSKQEQTLKRVTGLDVRPYSGGAVLPSAFDVLVSTPKAFEVAQSQVAKNCNLQWQNFRTVVFDDVHHVFKDHPYRKLALDLRASNARPRVMGLTSSFAYSMHEDKVNSTLKSICYDLVVHKVMTGTDEELKEFDEAAWRTGESVPEVCIEKTVPLGLLPVEERKPHKMLEKFFSRVLQGKSTPFADRLAKCVLRMELAMSRMDPTFRPPIHLDFCLKQWSMIAHRWAKQPGQSAEFIDLYTQLEHWYEALRMLIVSWEEDEFASVLVLKMVKCDHPRAWRAWPEDVYEHLTDFWRHEPRRFERLERLREALLSKNREILRFRGLLFVQQRLSTHILEWFVRHDRHLAALFTPACLYATSSPATPSLCVSKIQAKQNVDAFAQGRVNLLISTVVAEESMEIPTANCIIRFDAMHSVPQAPISTNSFIYNTKKQEDSLYEAKEEKQEARKVSMVCQISQDEKVKARGDDDLRHGCFPFPGSHNLLKMEDVDTRNEVHSLGDIRDSHRQMVLEMEATKFLQGYAHRKNCEAILSHFCSVTKKNVEIITHIDKDGVFMRMTYKSCLRSITVESRESSRSAAYNAAALDMVLTLRHQLLSRFGLAECKD